MQIKILHKQGKSLRSIACEVGCSVNTMRKYLAEDAAPALKGRVSRSIKLAPFEVASAAPDWIPATVLWREMREMGFTGCERTVRGFVARLRPVPVSDSVVRFETASGDQMQADWIEFRRRKGSSLFAFVATLGYSRASYVEFVSDMRLETLLACHANCFEWFGGVPRRALYDNMKTVVIERNAYGPGQHRFQPAEQLVVERSVLQGLLPIYPAFNKPATPASVQELRERYHDWLSPLQCLAPRCGGVG